jgi:hypothetical protein
MARKTTYNEIIGDLQRLSASLNSNAQDLGHMDGSRLKLDALLDRAMGISTQQAALKAGKQDLSRQIRQIIIDGQRLGNLLRFAVKEHYGPRSEKLAEFGVQPFRGRKTKPAGPELPTSTPEEP